MHASYLIAASCTACLKRACHSTRQLEPLQCHMLGHSWVCLMQARLPVCLGVSKHRDTCLTQQCSHHANTEPAELPTQQARTTATATRPARASRKVAAATATTTPAMGAAAAAAATTAAAQTSTAMTIATVPPCLPAPQLWGAADASMHLQQAMLQHLLQWCICLV